MKINLTKSPQNLRDTFFKLKTRKDIAILLEVTEKTLIFYFYRTPEAKRYTSFDIPKKSGGLRNIKAPINGIKIIQQKLSTILHLIYSPKASVHGFTKNRTILTNADMHCKKKYVLNIDILNFFPSINFGRVWGLFRAKPYSFNNEVATMLAQICCYENQLPQGAPTSPIISNMICSRLDTRLQHLAKNYRCTYTRYADDITFSTTRKQFPTELAYLDFDDIPAKLFLGKVLNDDLTKNGFDVNTKKSRLLLPQYRHEVTGLTVNQFPNVTRKYVNQIRAMLHAWKKFGEQKAETEFYQKYAKKNKLQSKRNPSFKEVVRGKLNFLSMIRGKGDPIFIRYAKILSGLDPEYKPIFEHKIQLQQDLNNPDNALWVVENEGNDYSQGTAFFLENVGLVTCYHVTRDKLEAYKAEQISKKYKVEISKHNSHYDLAILKIDISKQPFLKLGNSDVMKPDDEIILLGFPDYCPGHSIQRYRGRITGTKIRFGVTWFMIDAPIYKGSSGGPVLNKNNEVIGVATYGIKSTQRREEGEFGVIPINLITKL